MMFKNNDEISALFTSYDLGVKEIRLNLKRKLKWYRNKRLTSNFKCTEYLKL